MLKLSFSLTGDNNFFKYKLLTYFSKQCFCCNQIYANIKNVRFMKFILTTIRYLEARGYHVQSLVYINFKFMIYHILSQQEKIDNSFNESIKENNSQSTMRCQHLIQMIFGGIENALKDGAYTGKGRQAIFCCHFFEKRW